MRKKRIMAMILAAAILVTAIPNAKVQAEDGNAYFEMLGQQYKEYVDWSFSEEANAQLERIQMPGTGMAFDNTDTKKSGSDLGYLKAWLKPVQPKIVKKPLESNEFEVEINFADLDHHYISCIAYHVPANPGTLNFWLSQMALKSVYYPTDNPQAYPQMMRVLGNGDITILRFNLILMSLVHALHVSTDEAIKDSHMDTAYSVLDYCIARAIESNGGMTMTTPDADWNKLSPWTTAEIAQAFRPDKRGLTTTYDSLMGEVHTYFNDCWEKAAFLSQFKYSLNKMDMPLSEPLLGDDGLYHRTFDYSAKLPEIKKYMQALKIKTNAPGITYTNDGSKIDLAASSEEDLKENSEVLSQLSLDLDPSVSGTGVKIAPSILVGLKQVGIKPTATGIEVEPNGQERFTAIQQDLVITFGPISSGTDSSPSAPSRPVSSSSVTRYKHSETFTAHYNVNLHKFDSETGKGLEGSQFDILEAFDDSQLDSTDLESLENWQNENGSQFLKWEGWDYGAVANPEGDKANDPCDVDGDVTNEDGVLINANVGDIAHTDVKYYTYTKGYCGGHPPKPSDPDELAEWQAEVDKCEKLASEGGFFHSLTKGEAQKQMETDRDNYWKQFISLTYDYSAAEVEARRGYTLHDYHIDDIPIETKTVTSSELKALNANGGNIDHTSGSAAASISVYEDDDFVQSTANQIAVPNDEELKTSETLEYKNEDKKEEEKDEVKEDVKEEIKKEVKEEIIATPSNYKADFTFGDEVKQESEQEELKETEAEANTEETEEENKGLINYLKGLFVGPKSLFSKKKDDSNGVRMIANSGARAVSHPERDATSFKDSIANRVKPGDETIVDHTFVVFDHRTEGEIHFNKRDLSLADKEGDSYDAYADANGDGSMEGAVYGLFALQDINHPDGHTGVVYQKDDLVSITTTDRNGDGSFMVFTEAPGTVYNYEKGKTEKTDWYASAPKNMYTNRSDGDNLSEDNESYIGHDSQNQKQEIEDSEEGDETVYNKHSSNQEGPEGISGTFTTYPIENNEDNNGNCWIGRPLIVEGDGTSYYIKELSRSEGYELSVAGKQNAITNGSENYKMNFDNADVSISAMEYRSFIDALYATVKATNVTSDIHIRAYNLDEFAKFEIAKTVMVPTTYTIDVPQEKDVEVIGAKDALVYLDGERIKAELGEDVNVNGSNYEVTNTSDVEYPVVGAIPANTVSYGTPLETTFDTDDYQTFMDKYNEALEDIGYGVPSSKSPWARVALAGDNDTSWITSITEYITANDLIYYNRMRIQEILEDGENTYAILRYDHAVDGKVSDSIYSPASETIYLKKDMKNGNFVYVPYNVNSDAVLSINKSDDGFVENASIKAQTLNDNVSYPNELPNKFDLTDESGETYWEYDGIMQRFNDDGTGMTSIEYDYTPREIDGVAEEEVTTPLFAEYVDGYYEIVIPASVFDDTDEIVIKISSDDSMRFMPIMNQQGKMGYIPYNSEDDTYVEYITLQYIDQEVARESNETETDPVKVNQRPIRQRIKVVKDIQTTPDNEEYIHDTYSEVHDTNLTREDTNLWYADMPDWLTKLLGKEVEGQTPSKIPEFRFKAYLKSNLERLYRNNDGSIIWTDRNGNVLIPDCMDTNGDGNNDTFVWRNGNDVIDFPEKDIFENEKNLMSSNVQKLYTEVDHNTESTTTGDISNNTWAEYGTPQGGDTSQVGELREDNTSQDGDNGEAVYTNGALYSYDDKNVNVRETDRINADQNNGYTRLLETEVRLVEDGAGKTRNVEQYNYEKFFDAIAAANTDIWDNDMYSTYSGTGMQNYPGQHWFDTFEERYQKDDHDPDFTLPNVDNADADNSAGGDRDTSFKPFQWIREHFFGVTEEAKNDYTATHNNDNLENVINTSEFAHINSEASDAVRQFAIKWYLDDEVAKLLINNGYEEDVAKDITIDGTKITVNEEAGPIDYSEQIYDLALYNALKKTYNYIKPFYKNDLDTIYSVEWDTAENGGSDNDYTTLSADTLYNVAGEAGDQGQSKSGYYYGVSSYLPYGTYVLVEQQPYRENLNDFDNKHYKTDLPKEIELPAVYEEGGNTGAPEVMNEFYNYATADTPEKLAEKYFIRFNEEWAENHTDDLREYVIRSHNNDGDFEVYKYGLDVDKLTDAIEYPGGSYDYDGFSITQDVHDPLKNYYNDPLVDSAINGGNSESHYLADEKNKGVPTASGNPYEDDANEKRYHYGSISENYGTADDVIYPHGTAKDDNNPSGYYFKDGVKTMTGIQTAYEGKYASMLVPWTIVEPTESAKYDSDALTGYADRKFRNTFYTTKLRIEKLDSETGENILHDDAIFLIYAASRYLDRDEIEESAKLIKDEAARKLFIEDTEIGDTKMYLEDTLITGSYEFLTAMGARDIAPARRARGAGEVWSGIVPAGTPVCLEEEQIIMEDMLGSKTGQFKVYTTLNDIATLDDEAESDKDKTYRDQNTGYLVTPQPLGSGTYVLAETKAPAGYAKTKPMAIEVYSDSVSYYANGDMTTKVDATIYEGNLMDPRVEAKTEKQQDTPIYQEDVE